MIFKRLACLEFTRVFRFAAILVSCSASLSLLAEAQTAPARQNTPAAKNSASDPKSAVDAIDRIIAPNTKTPGKICPEITLFLQSNPELASEVINRAQAAPVLLEPLCACVSKVQKALGASRSVGARIIGKAVAESSPAFQACYAVALGLPNQEGGGSQVVSSGREAESDASRDGPYSPAIVSGASGFSGGLVSPN